MNGLEKTIKALAEADQVAVLTGAGISAESGVATFRGENGIWNKFKPEELASMAAFMKNPSLVWEWYAYRKDLLSKTKPNPGHYALVQMGNLFSRFTLITQNVDNLHTAAGSKGVLELHGNITLSFCLDCGERYSDLPEFRKDAPPRCTRCRGLLRPDVVWFGESLPQDIFRQAELASRECDIFLCIGTSSVVYPAALLPQYAQRSGATLVEINIEETDLTRMADISLLGKSGTILPDLAQRVRELKFRT